MSAIEGRRTVIRSPARDRWVGTAVLAISTGLLYARVASHSFIGFDDPMYVTENPHVLGGLSWGGIAWAFTTFEAGNWHPLTWLSHMMDVQLFGASPGGHHLVNAALHVADAVLLFLVLARMTGAQGRSLFVAVLFAVHPLHVESVAWISERKDVLSTFFGLLALGAYARYAERPGWRRYAEVALCFALSLLSKPMWVTLPFLLVLLDHWPLRRLAGWTPDDRSGPVFVPVSLRRSLVEKLPLLALAAASSSVTVAAQHQAGALVGLEFGLGARAANALVSYARYLQMTIWPARLAIYYPRAARLPAWHVVGAGALILGLTILVLTRVRRSPWYAVGWFWFLGTLVPVIGLVQVGDQALADRYTYVPVVGLFIATAWGANRLAGSWLGGLPLRAVATGLVVACCAVTWKQLGYWVDDEQLFRHALAVTTDNGRAHGILSLGLRDRGNVLEAALHAREAARLEPERALHWNNLATLERDLQHLPEARDDLWRAVRLDPSYARAWANLGQVDLELNAIDEAGVALAEAARLAPADARVRYWLGVLDARRGRWSEAMQDYREALRLQPDYAAAWTELAILSQKAGRTAEAESAFQAAVRAAPRDATAWRNLGLFLALNGRPKEAVDAFREALRQRPGDAELSRRLAVAQAALERMSAPPPASPPERRDPRRSSGETP